MVNIQLIDKNGNVGQPFQLPFVPRVGDYLNVDGVRWLVAEVLVVVAGGHLQVVQLAVS
jgi:hypothetical protein